jgi:hypothetical protein
MNPLPSKPANSSTSPTALRAGQIPTMHDLLDLEQVALLGDEFERSLETLEGRFVDYVTNVSLKKLSRR